MNVYLGETLVKIEDSPYASFSKTDWAMTYISRYGGFTAAYHKAWVLDQVARILKGSPIIDLRVAKWDNGQEEWRYNVGASPEYLAWVEEMKGDFIQGKDGNRDRREYAYDEGIPP